MIFGRHLNRRSYSDILWKRCPKNVGPVAIVRITQTYLPILFLLLSYQNWHIREKYILIKNSRNRVVGWHAGYHSSMHTVLFKNGERSRTGAEIRCQWRLWQGSIYRKQ